MNKFAVILLFAVGLTACEKDSVNGNADFFTPVQVNIAINLSLPNAAPLSVPQGYIYEFGGNKGIIIYRTIYNEYVAFDRTCPNNPTDACSFVSMDNSNAFYRCGQYTPGWTPCCNSKFDPATGGVLEGAAKRALKQYFVRQEGTMLYINSNPF